MPRRYTAQRAPVERRPSGFYRRDEVETLTTLSRTSIYERIRAGTFPPAVSLGGASVGWRCESINDWLDNPSEWTAKAKHLGNDHGNNY